MQSACAKCGARALERAQLKIARGKTWGRFLFVGDDTAFFRAIEAALP